MFVESYGQLAVQGSSFSPEVDAALAEGNKRLQSAGFSSRSGFLTSATFGGISWLAHSSLQSGLWVDNQDRYDQLLPEKRFTLAAPSSGPGGGPSTTMPSNDRPWPQGKAFYHWDQVYDRYQVGYHGPTFTYASMPDQYIFSALQRLELAKTAPAAGVRGGRHGLEPHAVEPHPGGDPLEPGRQRLDLQPHPDDPRDGVVLGATRSACRRRTAGRSCTR